MVDASAVLAGRLSVTTVLPAMLVAVVTGIGPVFPPFSSSALSSPSAAGEGGARKSIGALPSPTATTMAFPVSH